MAKKKLDPLRSPRKSVNADDSIREINQHLKEAGKALRTVINASVRANKAVNGQGQTVTKLKVTRSRVSGWIVRLSTTGPGRRQSIEMLVIGNRAYLKVLRSAKLAEQLNKSVRPSKRRASLDRL